MKEYPDTADLRKIERWQSLESMKDLIEFIEGVCNYDMVRWRFGRSNWDRKKCVKVEMHTGGWSGNEDIIESLKKSKSLFWFCYWQKSLRGGHFYFEVPLWAWQKK